jgi:hypothetical protein
MCKGNFCSKRTLRKYFGGLGPWTNYSDGSHPDRNKTPTSDTCFCNRIRLRLKGTGSKDGLEFYLDLGLNKGCGRFLNFSDAPA